MDFRLASPGYEEEWVGEFGDMRVEMLARELGFIKPPPLPLHFMIIRYPIRLLLQSLAFPGCVL